MSQPADAYRQLLHLLHENATLGSVAGVLHWDNETHMPPGGAELRSRQLALVARLKHEQFTSPRLGELLAELEQSDLARDAGSDAAANIRETRRDYDRAARIPPTLVEEIARTTVLAHKAWIDARKQADFRAFSPWLVRMLDLKRQVADSIGYENHPLDALIDTYEPGETVASLSALFDSLRPPLVELIGQIAASGRKPPSEILHRSYDLAAQRQLCREAAAAFGFDFSKGRLDEAVHPFCSGIGPGDVRMTTRYSEDYLPESFFSTLHEVGHALYEQGLPAEHFGTPLGADLSLGIHESQSRMWENMVGRSPAFWSHMLPRFRQLFPKPLAGVTVDQWLSAINEVKPNMIRIESDELIYNLHIMLRFDIEKRLFSADLDVMDIPAAWNQRMEQDLQLTPANDAQGCLQDVHWAHGALGYFPTYTLGNLYAAQFFQQARRDLGDLDADFARGDFSRLLHWLRQNIHRHGRRHPARILIRRVTGEDLHVGPLLDYLREKGARYYGV